MAKPHGPPPAGGDQSRVPLIIGFFSAMTVLSFLCTVVRLYTRIHLVRDPGIDDAIIVISEILAICHFGFNVKATTYGLGRHAYYLQRQRVHQATKWNFISVPFGILGVALPRLAIAMFIARVVGPNHRREMWALYFLTISVIVAGSISAILLFAQCNPPSTPWNPKPTSVCWKSRRVENYSIFFGVYSAFADFVLAFYPVRIISKLQMPVKRRVDISIIMSLGLIAGVCAIIRTTKIPELADLSDVLWTGVTILTTTTAEMNVLIICACIPTFLPLVQQLTGRKDYLSKSKSSNRKDSHKQASTGSSWRALPADPDLELMKQDAGGVDTAVVRGDETPRGNVPAKGIRTTTEVQTQWEAV